MSKCKFCGEEIEWQKDAQGKSHPVNAVTGTPHRCQKGGQQTTSSIPAPAIQPQQVIGMTDPAKVLKVSMGCTINLHDYNNLKIEVEATDATTAKRALIEILGVTIPAESAVARECIDRYVKAILVGGH
jgi:hypothetical protein